MPNNNVAILSIMSKFDEKSAREAAKRADKVYEEALSDIGNVNFDKKLIENFDKAMNLLKNKFKKVNLSSYTNSLLDSIFSDKDIKEKSKDIELFISKIEMLLFALAIFVASRLYSLVFSFISSCFCASFSVPRDFFNDSNVFE